MSLNLRMLLAPITLIFVIFAIGLIGYSALSNTTTQFNRLAAESIPNIRLSDEMFLNFRQIRISIRTLGITGISKSQEDAAIKETLAAIAAYEENAKIYEKIEFAPGEEALYKNVSDAWASFKATGVRILELHASGTSEDKAKIIDIFFKDCPEKAEVYRLAITALVDFHKKNSADWTTNAREAAASAKNWILVAIGTGLVLGVALALFTIKSVSGLIGAISKVVGNLTENANSVSRISSSISDASEKLSSSSTEQAAAIQETTSAIEETSQMVQKNADNAERSASASKSSHEDAENGKRAVTDMIQSIELISQSNKNVMTQFEGGNAEMASIVALINEIGDKTKVINDIVFQTKLLSFNASVEAARAGEHGKGFAVVAEEVGNLASMSGRSAKEITDLLEKSTQRVQDIVATSKSRVESLMRESSDRVNQGTHTAHKCGEALAEIVTKVASVNNLVGEIASASQEQSKGIGEINKAITQLDTAAQENAATSQNAATSATELSEQVVNLHGAIESLNHLVNGSQKSSGTITRAPVAAVATMRRESRAA